MEPLDATSSNFNAHLQEIAAEYSRLLERCRTLERSMNDSMDNALRASDGIEAPRVPTSSADSAGSDGVLGNRGPEDSTHPRMQAHTTTLSQIEAKVRSGSLISKGDKRSIADGQVQLRNCWSGASETSTEIVGLCDSVSHVSRTNDTLALEPVLQRHRRGCVISAVDPDSLSRLIFECITVFVCLYDAIVVPFELAWQPERSYTITVFAVATVVFWWSEMGLNFFTGYVCQGVLVLDIKQTAWTYLRSWFILDFFINIVDLAILVLDITLGTEQNGPAFLKYLRIGKLNRLARIMVVFNRNRLQQVMRSLSIDSSNFTLLGLGMRLIAILLLLNHVICCAWFGIGSISGDSGKSWLDMSITSGGLQYRSAPPSFQYLTSLHWAFTQMTPGSMSVVPQNSLERAWNVLCLILGLFVGALLISQLSAKMVRVQTTNSAQLQQMETLGRFLVEHDVPRSLAQRIRRQTWERVSHTKMLTKEDLPLLVDLPTSLKQELDGALFARSLLSHSVLYSWCLVHDGIAQAICCHVAREEACARNDEIFVPGQEANKFYFLQRGSMNYRREMPLPSSSSIRLGRDSESEFPDVSVTETDWISTIAMWCHWNYVGRLNACEACNVVAFDMNKMVDVLNGYPWIRALSSSYASAFVLMGSFTEHAIKVDLDISASRVLMAMPLDERVSFSCRLLNSFQAKAGRVSMEKYFPIWRQRLGPQEQKRLVEELETGRCVVTIGKDYQLLRTVVLCVLDIVDSTGRVLVQMATKKQGEDVALEIALPATKVRECESNRKAALRLIHTELPDMVGTLNFNEVLNEEHETNSKQLGIRTTYMKTTYKASLWPEDFQDLFDRESRPKFVVNDPPPDWTTSQSLTGDKSALSGIRRALSFRGRSMTGSIARDGVTRSCSMFADVTILAVKCEDKTKFYAWLLRHEFHRVKQVVPSNEQELRAKVMQAFSESEGLPMRVSDGEGEASASADSSLVDI